MKRFDLEDQRRFASLSGDFNPLHLDPVYSRRLLFGGPVVHGAHLVLYGLDKLLRDQPSPRVIKHLSAVFNRPLPLGQTYQIEIIATGDDRYEIRALGNQCQLLVEFQPQEYVESWSFTLPEARAPSLCRELSFAEAARGQGVTPLYLNLAELQSMFPDLANKISPLQTAQILATTRLTGMDCPGLHTIFHSLDLNFQTKAEPLEMRYRATRGDERFSTLHLAVESCGLRGELAAFYRPAPVEQPAYAEVAQQVRPDEFRHLRALIVGGSRGLGELSAKIIAAGSGEVAITYHLGKSDAQRVAHEIGGLPEKCRFFPLDVTELTSLCWEELLPDWRPTHLFYFATPHIGSASPEISFCSERFQRFCEYYVTGFCRLLESLLAWAPSELRFFYPSTVLLDTSENGREEYLAAKSAGETLCRYFSARSPRLKFHVPRLPWMRTDQTAGIRPRRHSDSLPIMLAEIRRLEG